jgi:steroid delta-isomerase-like uncharacterized protein
MSEFHEQNNKSIVKRFYEEVLNRGDLDTMISLVKDDFIENSPVAGQAPGLEGLVQRINALRSAFPDLRFTLEEILADGEKVVARWNFSGTHTGKFMDFEPTEARLNVAGIDFFRMSEGRIKERWQFVDSVPLLGKLAGLKVESVRFVL